MEVGIEDALHIEFEYNKSRLYMLSSLIDVFAWEEWGSE